jgi:hypothetical protein
MELHELLESAISLRQAIKYEYVSGGAGSGVRVGSPHALYVHPTTRNVSCDIFQHSGASASNNEVPFKPFLLKKLRAVEVLPHEKFQRWDLYDPDAPRYANAIAKIG